MVQYTEQERRSIWNSASRDKILDVICREVYGATLAEKRAADNYFKVFEETCIFYYQWQVANENLAVDHDYIERQAAICENYGIDPDLLQYLNPVELNFYCRLTDLAAEYGVEGMQTPQEMAIWLAEKHLFRGDKLTLVIKENEHIKKNAIGEDDKKISKNYLIKWRGVEYTVEQFFAAAFPEYKKYPYLCNLTDDVRRISKSQRDRLQYEVLAAKYCLVEVDAADENALKMFFTAHAEDGGKSFQRISQRLQWKDGLAKMVTFGAQIKVSDEAVPAAWAYTIDRRGDGNTYSNAPMEWDKWLDGIERAAQAAYRKETGASQRTAYISIAYQDGVYLSIPGVVRRELEKWVSDMLAGHGYRPIPDSLPPIMNDGYEFSVWFDEVILRANQKLDAETMGEYNRLNNAAKNAKVVKERAAKALAGFGKGEVITKKQLVEIGYNNHTIMTLKRNGIIKSVSYGKYEVI